MRRLQLGTSQEGQSQLSPHSPCSERLLLPEGTEEEEDEQSSQFDLKIQFVIMLKFYSQIYLNFWIETW